MAEDARLICVSNDLTEAGRGVRFLVQRYGQETPAFIIRFHGRVHAYLNQCAHVPAQLDWQPGEFFDTSGLYLICSIHGALYSPATGQCLGGRCQSRGLTPLPVEERDGAVYLLKENHHG